MLRFNSKSNPKPNGALAGSRNRFHLEFKQEGLLRVLERSSLLPFLPDFLLRFSTPTRTKLNSRAQLGFVLVATILGLSSAPSFLTFPLPGANGVRNETWLVDRLSCPCFTSVISATLKLCHGLQGFVVNHYLPLSDCSLLHTVDAWLSAASWVTNISC